MNNFIIFAAAILLIPWLAVEAQQQQRPAVRQRHESPHEAESLHTLEATKVPLQLETPLTPGRRKSTLSVNNNSNDKNRQFKNDASAIATLAPAKSAVALPPARRSIPTGGLTSLHTARSLEDWEVEDFVLLATVDGKLYARDRKNGKEKWVLEVDKPMVETTYHRKNRSSVDEDYDPLSIDDYLWIVEPSRDGSLYVYRPGGPDPGLVNTNLTMKKLVDDMSPYSSLDPPVVYNGRKETTMVTIDAKDGQVLKWFGSTSALVNDESCLNKKGLVDTDSEECSTSPTLTIGRTEYTVGIQGKDGHLIATLKFSEWSPNNYDHDLQRQYHTTLDNKYIYTSHDGGVIGFDHDRSSTSDPGRPFQQKFQHKFASPVVRVFDVARPWGTEKEDPELIVLPQPMPPDQGEDEISANHRARSIFLNHTEDGSWYAMSGKFYPLAVQGIGPAQCNQQGWQQYNHWDGVNDVQFSKALVGLHSIDNGRSETLLTISPPEDNRTESLPDSTLVLLGKATMWQRLQGLPRTAIDYLVSFIQNPVMILIVIGLLVSNQREIRIRLGQFGTEKELSRRFESPVLDEQPGTTTQSVLPKVPEDEVAQIAQVDGANEGTVDNGLSVTNDSSAVGGSTSVANSESKDEATLGKDLHNGQPHEKEKKKAHRGRRGGVKHKKGPTSGLAGRFSSLSRRNPAETATNCRRRCSRCPENGRADKART